MHRKENSTHGCERSGRAEPEGDERDQRGGSTVQDDVGRVIGPRAASAEHVVDAVARVAQGPIGQHGVTDGHRAAGMDESEIVEHEGSVEAGQVKRDGCERRQDTGQEPVRLSRSRCGALPHPGGLPPPLVAR
jgi:hypothetical protein